MTPLDLSGLPSLPQMETLRDTAARLWAEPAVIAVWLGGSFAAGTADAFSDVDLRIAVATPADWERPRWERWFARPVVGASLLRFGDDALLHHEVLADGTIVDLFVQTPARENPEHAVRVLGCRDVAFGERLATFGRPMTVRLGPPDPAAVRQLVVDNWTIAHKHRKVLARGLELIAPTGLQIERANLLRLLHVLHAGTDLHGPPSIHGLTPVARAVQAAGGPGVLDLIGRPTRDRAEIIAATIALQDALADVGRQLAARLGFDYPAELERTVRAAWARFPTP